jgi:Ca-activated chloride channel family protein
MAPKTLYLLLTALVTVAPAQVVVGARSTPGVIRVDVDLVNVLCSVRDKKGTWAEGLTRNDFEVKEDGKVRPLSHFAADTDSPLTVALLVDVSGSVASILEIERAAARRFLREVIRPGDQALVGGFASTIAVHQDLTPSVGLLDAALERLGTATDYPADGAVRPRGGTLLYDAMDLIATRKLAPVPGRKALVLITDGLDNGSKASIEQAVKAAQSSDTIVFAIHYVPESAGYTDGRRPLARLAEPTGGRVFQVSEKMPLERVFTEIADEMRHQYSLGFTPASRDGAFHKLEVVVKRPGFKPQARNGYYAVQR